MSFNPSPGGPAGATACAPSAACAAESRNSISLELVISLIVNRPMTSCRSFLVASRVVRHRRLPLNWPWPVSASVGFLDVVSLFEAGIGFEHVGFRNAHPRFAGDGILAAGDGHERPTFQRG